MAGYCDMRSTEIKTAGTAAGQLASLQYLRGVAALLVVYFHAIVQVRQAAGFTPFTMLGMSGVDIFFVLSGFVMWMTTVGKQTKGSTFLIRRLVRIAPLYWLLTMAAAMIALWLPHLLRSTTFDVEHLIASLFFIPWWHPAASPTSSELFSPVIVPGWTLNMEMMFYALFALTLVLPVRYRLGAMAGLLVAVYASASLLPRTNPLSFYGSTLLAQFLAGMFLSAIAHRLPRVTWRTGLALIICAFAGLFLCEFYRLEPRGLIYGIPAVAIVAVAVAVERSHNLPKWRLGSILGDASYSIYLTHVFVIAGTRVAFSLAGVNLDRQTGYVFVPLAVLASCVVGVATHFLLERPLTRFANSLVTRKARSTSVMNVAPS